jgi:hypothetical protein
MQRDQAGELMPRAYHLACVVHIGPTQFHLECCIECDKFHIAHENLCDRIFSKHDMSTIFQAGRSNPSARIEKWELTKILQDAGINGMPEWLVDSLWSKLKTNADGGALASDVLVYFAPVKVARHLNKLNKKAEQMRSAQETALECKRFQQAATLGQHVKDIVHEIDVSKHKLTCFLMRLSSVHSALLYVGQHDIVTRPTHDHAYIHFHTYIQHIPYIPDIPYMPHTHTCV